MDVIRPKHDPENEPQRYREGPVAFEPLTREELEAIYRDARLSIPAGIRIPLATMLSFGAGFALGGGQGSKMSGLRFRAEHAHKLPTTTTGWYLYHKSKNYHVMKGGVREGLKMGAKVSFLTTAMFAIEQMFDTYRGTADLLNTVTSCVTVAGGFSLWSRCFWVSLFFSTGKC